MAFSNIGDFTLAAGQSQFNGITFPDGNGDHGAQFISGHPTPPFRNATLVMTEQQIALGNDNRYHYGVKITNAGPLDVHYSLTGGGFI